jgi:hypothetical protein
MAAQTAAVSVALGGRTAESPASYLLDFLEVQPAAAPPETADLASLQRSLWNAADPELLATMLKIGDRELTREGRMCLLVTISRFAPNSAMVEALEMLAWDEDKG